MSRHAGKFKRREENIFELENPEQYGCHVKSFTTGPGNTLKLVAVKGPALEDQPSENGFRSFDAIDFPPEPKVQLYFYSVAFFDGPIGWQSANFRLGTADQILALLKLLGHLPDTVKLGEPAAKLADAFELFLVSTPNYEI